jgi:hypothetical protein
MSEKSPTLVLRNPNIQNRSDMAKVAIKSENITSFGGIFHVMDIFSRLGLEKQFKIDILYIILSDKHDH